MSITMNRLVFAIVVLVGCFSHTIAFAQEPGTALGNVPVVISCALNAPCIWTNTQAFNGGKVLIGTSTSISEGPSSNQAAQVQLHGASTIGATANISEWSNDTGSTAQTYMKSRGTAIGTHGAASSGDNIQVFTFRADDGTNYPNAGQLIYTIDGAVSAGVVPGRMTIVTANASGALEEGFRLDSAQHVRLTNNLPTISSGDCGATTNGTVSGTSNDHDGQINIGSATTTICTVTFGVTYATAPRACVISPASAGAAALTVLSYVSSVGTSNFVITGAALASTSFYYHCM